MFIIVDTETTGLPKRWNAPITDTDNWPRLVQLAWIIYDKNGKELKRRNRIVKPEGFIIPEETIKIHRITNERANSEGVGLKSVLEEFSNDIKENSYLIAHNISFDESVISCELFRKGVDTHLYGIKFIDTKDLTVDFCKVESSRGYKWPSLAELHEKLFNVGFEDAHDALVDVEALSKCFFELKRINYFGFKNHFKPVDYNVLQNIKYEGEEIIKNDESFVNLGVHSYYSVFEAAGSAEDYCKLAKSYNHKAIGLSDFGNLSGAFNFYQKCKDAGIKPVFGADLFLNDNIGQLEQRKFEGENYLIKIFVKDYEGYVNLNKLLFLSFDKGYYFKGRITTDWLLEHSKGLFVTTTGLKSKINHYLGLGHEDKAEEYLLKLYEVFGENLIADIQFNKEYDQKIYNDFIIRMADKYNLRLIVTNNVMYATSEDAQLKDVIVAIGEKKSVQEIPYDKNRHYFYVKSEDIYQFNYDFGFDYPDWLIDKMIKETSKIADECNFKFDTDTDKYPKYEPNQDVVDYFKTSDNKEIIYKLAHAKLKQRLKQAQDKGVMKVTKELFKEYEDRLNYELEVISDKGYLDYFLVLWELIRYCNDNDIAVGPGRGCFVPGSRVKMEDGLYAPIETIEKGNIVFDAHGNKQKVTDTMIYNVEEEIVELEFEDGRIIKCTKDHEILTKNRSWVKAIELTEQDDISEI